MTKDRRRGITQTDLQRPKRTNSVLSTLGPIEFEVDEGRSASQTSPIPVDRSGTPFCYLCAPGPPPKNTVRFGTTRFFTRMRRHQFEHKKIQAASAQGIKTIPCTMFRFAVLSLLLASATAFQASSPAFAPPKVSFPRIILDAPTLDPVGDPKPLVWVSLRKKHLY